MQLSFISVLLFVKLIFLPYLCFYLEGIFLWYFPLINLFSSLLFLLLHLVEVQPFVEWWPEWQRSTWGAETAWQQHPDCWPCFCTPPLAQQTSEAGVRRKETCNHSSCRHGNALCVCRCCCVCMPVWSKETFSRLEGARVQSDNSFETWQQSVCVKKRYLIRTSADWSV